MLRHLRVKHPKEVAKKCKGRAPENIPTNAHPEVDTDSKQFCSVEVSLEDGDSDIHTTMNESDISSGINGILEAAQGGPAEQVTHGEASDGRPMRRSRHKRSLIWRHYEHLDSLNAARCRICMKKLQCFEGGSTSNLHRHMSKRHPEVFSRLVTDGLNPPPSSQGSNAHGDKSTSPETAGATEQRRFTVEVALEDGDSDIHTTMNESDISSGINGILEAAQGDPAEQEQVTHGEASDGRPMRRNRHKRSLIWRHYERLDSLNAARCRICMKKLQCFEGSGTSNLRRHMSKRHPEVFSRLVANGLNPPPSSQGSNAHGDKSTSPETAGATEQRRFTGALKGSRACEGERRVLRRERELIEALRRTQKEEARALEQQRELLEKLQAAGAREAAAERETIESLRKAQEEEAKELSRQREELQKEKAELQKKTAELQKKWEELQQEREEHLLFSRGQ
ncbi:zinc finger BED domain-containing protein isoform X2 [Toxotes jaculatrix]|nr:zinc finger BED domain-containing protein isoform X2 [Toxotes jaculatrix]